MGGRNAFKLSSRRKEGGREQGKEGEREGRREEDMIIAGDYKDTTHTVC